MANPNLLGNYNVSDVGGRYKKKEDEDELLNVPVSEEAASPLSDDYINTLLSNLYTRSGGGGYYAKYTPGEWDQRADALGKQAIGMNYQDWTQGDAYKALVDRYQQSGNRAMLDTLGTLAARTGGLASSYAGAAAQNSYNDYMRQLEDVAYSMYGTERNNILENAALARAYADRDYERWSDDYARRKAASSGSGSTKVNQEVYDLLQQYINQQSEPQYDLSTLEGATAAYHAMPDDISQKDYQTIMDALEATRGQNAAKGYKDYDLPAATALSIEALGYGNIPVDVLKAYLDSGKVKTFTDDNGNTIYYHADDHRYGR